MKITPRLLSLYSVYLSRTLDEGLPALPLGELLGQLDRADRRGVTDRCLGYTWGVPVELVRELRSATERTATSLAIA